MYQDLKGNTGTFLNLTHENPGWQVLFVITISVVFVVVKISVSNVVTKISDVFVIITFSVGLFLSGGSTVSPKYLCLHIRDKSIVHPLHGVHTGLLHMCMAGS